MYAPAIDQLLLTAPEFLPRPEGHESFQSLNNCTNVTQIIESVPTELLWIQSRLWRKIIWDDVAKKMVMGNATQIELMLLYIMAPELLSDKEHQKMIDNLKSFWDETDEAVIQERLDAIIRGDEYV